jgi:hypothetical protein
VVAGADDRGDIRTAEYLRHHMNRIGRDDRCTEPISYYALSLQTLVFSNKAYRACIAVEQSHSVMALEGSTSLHRYAGYVDHSNQEFGVAKNA